VCIESYVQAEMRGDFLDYIQNPNAGANTLFPSTFHFTIAGKKRAAREYSSKRPFKADS
jgi:hypothetical protein